MLHGHKYFQHLKKCTFTEQSIIDVNCTSKFITFSTNRNSALANAITLYNASNTTIFCDYR